ncbi:hypothetical protein BDV95DRAFT_346682 [Massariosphaeria phaeospora]|uniref:Uncharacterized protein n=1 Tax=Massariosphaeria phaeospora TaxID=100035 RepID=A0A7C8M8D3_9PLEO|nr:hypothetical protein BDV95DRAFT_346682 [Massariosphaeria phaeospora]
MSSKLRHGGLQSMVEDVQAAQRHAVLSDGMRSERPAGWPAEAELASWEPPPPTTACQLAIAAAGRADTTYRRQGEPRGGGPGSAGAGNNGLASERVRKVVVDGWPWLRAGSTGRAGQGQGQGVAPTSAVAYSPAPTRLLYLNMNALISICLHGRVPTAHWRSSPDAESHLGRENNESQRICSSTAAHTVRFWRSPATPLLPVLLPARTPTPL